MSGRFLALLTISLFIAWGSKSDTSSAEPGLQERSQTAREFYGLLEKTNDVASAVQIAQLEAFVLRHPWFSRSASWLFDRYLITKNLERAENFFVSLADSRLSRSTKYWMLAKIYAHQNRTNKSLKAFTIALASEPPSPELILDYVVFDSRNLSKCAEPAYLKGLPINQTARDLLHALWFYANHQWQPAIDKLNGLPPELQDNPTVLYSWGYCLRRSGENRSASEKWERGLKIARKLGDLEFECKFHIALGNASGSLEATLSHYDSAYVIAKEIDDLRWLEFLAGNRGILYSRQGHFSLADSLFREAIDVGRRMRSPWRMSVWYPRYGNLLLQQDRLDEALKTYDEGVALAQKAGNTEVLVRCKIREGELYRLLGHFELARRALETAHQEAQRKEWPLLAVQSHTELAHLELAEGNYEDARHIYSQYLKSSPITRDDMLDHAWWRIQSGRSYLAQNNYGGAGHDFLQAYNLSVVSKSHYYTALSLLHLAEIDLAENDLESLHNRLDECLNLTEQTELERIMPAAFSLRGEAYRKANKLEKATTQYKHAANLIEHTRDSLATEDFRIDYFGDKSDVYDKLVDCYRKMWTTTNDPAYRDSLYAYLELKLSRTLRELRADNENESSDPDSDFQREKLHQAAIRLRAQQRHLRENRLLLTNQELDSVMTQVQTSRLSLIAQKLRLTQETTLDSDSLLATLPALDQLSGKLQENKSAVIYYQFATQPFALVITGDTTAVVPLPTTAAALDSAVVSLLNPFHAMTTSADAMFRAGLSHELYGTLVAPVERAVALPANLLIVPDAHVANLPFELLLTIKPEKPQYGVTDAPSYADDFLIHRYSIAYIPSVSFLGESRLRPASPEVLVFADPFDQAVQKGQQLLTSLRTGLSFNPLVFSSKEAEGIKEVHPNTTIYSREAATKARWFREAPEYDILHFATHAFVDTVHDAFSGLVLSTSNDQEDDGLLMGYEIAKVKLNADLVALSACETGRGQVVAGEGVLGLPRLFLGAGANSVLMTHWKVDDRFAADLMVSFYDYYLNQGLPKAQALTAAKRSFLASTQKSDAVHYQHPLFWASFVMYGEPGFGKQNVFAKFATMAVVGLLMLLSGIAYYQWRRKSFPRKSAHR